MTSLVVPVSREDPDVLERCLRTWLAESPDEIILVVDDQDPLLLGRLHDLALPTVRIVAWRHAGKRDALGAGVRLAEGEVIVFCDSDTSWWPGLLAALQMPFVDPRMGGVGSRPDSDPRRPVAYWMLNTRYLDDVPAMSRAGGVACLSGRTAAYRRSVILPVMPSLEREIFLAVAMCFVEGTYAGSAVGNWCQISGREPARSDGNMIVHSTISDTAAESIDIKEGTTGGVVQDNVFDGAGLRGDVDSWADVKGNGWVIRDNQRTSAPGSGFEVHRLVQGWVTGNVFDGNSADNRVTCSNSAVDAAPGLTNTTCG